MLSADILADVVSGVPVRLSPKTTTTHKLTNTCFFSIEVLIKIEFYITSPDVGSWGCDI